MSRSNGGAKGRPEITVETFTGADESDPTKKNGKDREPPDDGTGPVSRKRFDKVRRRLKAANDAIEARYGDLADAVKENTLLAAKVETANKITRDHKDITRRMQAQHQAQRVELEQEIADRAATERALRSEIHALRVRLQEAGGGNQR